MKSIFVTYNDNGKVKKAELTEEKLSELKKNSLISEIVVFSDKRLMEQHYSIANNGKGDNRKFLMS